jgi:hypothetical protein
MSERPTEDVEAATRLRARWNEPGVKTGFSALGSRLIVPG